jgi:hypothetical protein
MAALSPQRLHQALRRIHHVFRADEGSLDIDLREFGLAIRSQILIAKTARDLKVPVEPGDHQQLLVELRRLRQRVELPGMHATRHEVVASALGSRLGENRRLHLEEPEGVEVATSRLHEAVPEDDVPLQLGTSQIEVSVSEPKLFRGQHLALPARHGNRRRHRGADDTQAGGADLDVARRELGVAHLLGPSDDVALDEHDRLGPERCGGIDHRLLGGARVE